MPMSPLAPGRLSTTTCCPSASLSFTPMVRASVSVLPPGANGTTNRTGRVGYCCDRTGAAQASARKKAATLTGRLITRRSLLLQGAGVIAPALPRPALVVAYRLVLEHRAHQRGDLGLIAVLALPDFPLLAGRQHWRLQDFPQLHANRDDYLVTCVLSPVGATCASGGLY